MSDFVILNVHFINSFLSSSVGVFGALYTKSSILYNNSPNFLSFFSFHFDSAIEIYGQFVYVHPTYKVVIAKTSAYVNYSNSGSEMEFETMEAFRAIAKYL